MPVGRSPGTPNWEFDFGTPAEFQAGVDSRLHRDPHLCRIVGHRAGPDTDVRFERGAQGAKRSGGPATPVQSPVRASGFCGRWPSTWRKNPAAGTARHGEPEGKGGPCRRPGKSLCTGSGNPAPGRLLMPMICTRRLAVSLPSGGRRPPPARGGFALQTAALLQQPRSWPSVPRAVQAHGRRPAGRSRACHLGAPSLATGGPSRLCGSGPVPDHHRVCLRYRRPAGRGELARRSGPTPYRNGPDCESGAPGPEPMQPGLSDAGSGEPKRPEIPVEILFIALKINVFQGFALPGGGHRRGDRKALRGERGTDGHRSRGRHGGTSLEGFQRVRGRFVIDALGILKYFCVSPRRLSTLPFAGKPRTKSGYI